MKVSDGEGERESPYTWCAWYPGGGRGGGRVGPVRGRDGGRRGWAQLLAWRWLCGDEMPGVRVRVGNLGRNLGRVGALCESVFSCVSLFSRVSGEAGCADSVECAAGPRAYVHVSSCARAPWRAGRLSVGAVHRRVVVFLLFGVSWYRLVRDWVLRVCAMCLTALLSPLCGVCAASSVLFCSVLFLKVEFGPVPTSPTPLSQGAPHGVALRFGSGLSLCAKNL